VGPFLGSTLYRRSSLQWLFSSPSRLLPIMALDFGPAARSLSYVATVRHGYSWFGVLLYIHLAAMRSSGPEHLFSGTRSPGRPRPLSLEYFGRLIPETSSDDSSFFSFPLFLMIPPPYDVPFRFILVVIPFGTSALVFLHMLRGLKAQHRPISVATSR